MVCPADSYGSQSAAKSFVSAQLSAAVKRPTKTGSKPLSYSSRDDIDTAIMYLSVKLSNQQADQRITYTAGGMFLWCSCQIDLGEEAAASSCASWSIEHLGQELHQKCFDTYALR